MTEPPSLAPPTPVQSLGYSDSASEGTSFVVVALGVAGIALGALNIAYSAAQLSPSFMKSLGNRVSFGMPLDFSRPLYVFVFLIELTADAAAIALIVASASLRSTRLWPNKTMVVALAIISAGYTIQWIVRLVDFFQRASVINNWSGREIAAYLLMTTTGLARYLLLPALMIWLLAHPSVRRDQNRSMM